MQTLSVTNLRKYQHYTHRNPPWIKLYREFWTDYTLRQLPISTRLLFIGLSSLAMECENKIPADPHYLSDRLGFKITPKDISNLISSNLILSNLEEHVASAVLAECKQDASETSKALKDNDNEWIEQLKCNPAYRHINFPVELGKMDAWLALPKNRQREKTKSFVLNWLNKIETPMSNGGVNRPPPPPPKNDPIGRGQWKSVYGRPEDHGYQ